jgi:multidrug resistance efflux pump
MRDIVKSLEAQAEGMKDNVAQHESTLNEAKSEVQSYAARAEDARIIFDRAKQITTAGFGTQRDYDNKSAAYSVAVAELNAGKARVIQMTAALAQSKADLDRAIADLGTPGEDNPRLRRAQADLETAQLNLEFTKVSAPSDGYVTNLQLQVGDSAVANQPILAVIDGNSFYVEAFFRETFLESLQNGDRAIVTLMSYPSSLGGQSREHRLGHCPTKRQHGLPVVALREPDLRVDPTRAAHTGNYAPRKSSRQRQAARRDHRLGVGHDRDEHWW